MGRIRELAMEVEATTSSSSPKEALLSTTMCIIGIPVEVHIKDGSVYSGIFHTASLHMGYGIALKKARMIKKGTHNANVPHGGLIDTLVVLPEDLVQVVAKGVMFPADIVSSAATCDDGEAVSGTSDSLQGSDNGAIGGQLINQERQVGLGRPRDEEDGYRHHSDILKEVFEVHGPNTSLSGCYTEVNAHKENHTMMASNQLANGPPSSNDAVLNAKLINQLHDSHHPKEIMRTESVASEVSGSSKPESDASRGSLAFPAETSPRQNPLTNRTSKESKLNPGAKVFSPSFPNYRSTPPLAPTVPNMAYVPNNIPAVQVAAAQPEVGIRPIAQRSTWPVKFVPYVNSTPTNADNSLQYSQPIAGHITTMAQHIRHVPQYEPIQAVPPYVHPNPQNAMFGRPGQVVYVHPVTHDVIQGPPAFSQAPHPLLSSHQIHVAKHEGVFAGQPLQVSMTPPLMTNVPQQFAMPNHHIQLSQPLFSSIRPVPVLGSNVSYISKFP